MLRAAVRSLHQRHPSVETLSACFKGAAHDHRPQAFPTAPKRLLSCGRTSITRALPRTDKRLVSSSAGSLSATSASAGGVHIFKDRGQPSARASRAVHLEHAFDAAAASTGDEAGVSQASRKLASERARSATFASTSPAGTAAPESGAPAAAERAPSSNQPRAGPSGSPAQHTQALMPDAKQAGMASAEQEVKEPGLGDEQAPARAERGIVKAQRGKQSIIAMTSWQEMGQWLVAHDLESTSQLFPTEISRMWTGIVEHHMTGGRGGIFDERVDFPTSPLFSRDGRRFLVDLSAITSERLRYTLHGRHSNPKKWEAMRLRAPDVGRIVWAMGKLRWRHKGMLRLAEKVAVDDFACPWNRPRYMTTAMWGAAWANPSSSLARLARCLQEAPNKFWKKQATTQNATNLMWALSTMRHRPSEEFSCRMQGILLSQLHKSPGSIHPQNIGDMVQALAVLRLPVLSGLLTACDTWIFDNTKILLPNHALAYLNGIGLLGKLDQSTMVKLLSSMEPEFRQCPRPSEEWDTYAYRVFVLAHLAENKQQPAASTAATSKLVADLTLHGTTVCREVLKRTAFFLENSDAIKLLQQRLEESGYTSEIGARAVLTAIKSHGVENVTPLVPELLVHQRAADGSRGKSAPVLMQVIVSANTFSNEDTEGLRALGEAALVQRHLDKEPLPFVQLFEDDWCAESEEQQRQALSALLSPHLPSGVMAHRPHRNAAFGASDELGEHPGHPVSAGASLGPGGATASASVAQRM